MRILFFSHYFPPEVNAPASRTFENCKRWVRKGHEVTVVTCAPNCPDGVVYDGYKNRLWQSEVVDGIRVVRVWTYIAANRGAVRRIMNFVSYMCSAALLSLLRLKKPDVIIATSPQFFCGWAGLIASRLRRVPFLLEIRDIWPDSIVVVGAMKNKSLLRVLYRLEGRMYAAANRIVTVGSGYKADLVDKGVPERQIAVVPNGVDKELFSPAAADKDTARRYFRKDGFTCAYVGTIGMACGLDVVLAAARILQSEGRRDVRFLLVGDGARRRELETTAREEGLDNVVFTGRVPKHRVPRILSAADACLVHLKKADLFKRVLPSKIFEMAAMAKPIILGVEGCAAEVIRDAGAGICIEPENPQALAEAVKRLAGDRPWGKSLGLAGHHFVMKHYNRDVLADDYLDVLEQVVQTKR